MPFLTRWDEDQTRPAFTSALRDVAVRAVLPALGVFAVVVAFGFLLKGPLDSFSEWENNVNRWFQDGRTARARRSPLFMSRSATPSTSSASRSSCRRSSGGARSSGGSRSCRSSRSRCRPRCSSRRRTVVGRDRPDVERLDPTPPTSSYPAGTWARRRRSTELRLMAARGSPTSAAAGRRRAVRRRAGSSSPTPASTAARTTRRTSCSGSSTGCSARLLAWNYLRREPGGRAGDDATRRTSLRPARSGTARRSRRRRPRCPRRRG